MWLYGGIFVLLVAFTAFFNLTEMALIVSRPERLKSASGASDQLINQVLAVKNNTGALLAATQSGITVMSILAGTFCVTELANELSRVLDWLPVLHPYATGVATFLSIMVATFLTLIFGELLPKRVALAAPERCAMFVIVPMRWAMVAVSPFVALLLLFNNLLLRLLNVPESPSNQTTAEEIHYVIAGGLESGTIKAIEHSMLESILELGVRSARTVMTSRRRLEFVDEAMSAEEIEKRIAETPCSRLIITRDKDLDRPIGVVAKKDILTKLLQGGTIDYSSITQAPVFVSETSTVLGLLNKLKHARAGMLFVVDEFGSVVGIITLHDVLEVVAGDVPEPERNAFGEKMLKKQDDGSYIVSGSLPADDLTEYLGLKDDSLPDYKTVAGLVLSKLKHLPQPGEKLNFDGWTIEVLDADARSVKTLRLIPSAKGGAETKES